MRDRVDNGAEGDITSAGIFKSVLVDEEQHIEDLDTRLRFIEKLCEQPAADGGKTVHLEGGGARTALRRPRQPSARRCRLPYRSRRRQAPVLRRVRPGPGNGRGERSPGGGGPPHTAGTPWAGSGFTVRGRGAGGCRGGR